MTSLIKQWKQMITIDRDSEQENNLKKLFHLHRTRYMKVLPILSDGSDWALSSTLTKAYYSTTDVVGAIAVGQFHFNLGFLPLGMYQIDSISVGFANENALNVAGDIEFFHQHNTSQIDRDVVIQDFVGALVVTQGQNNNVECVLATPFKIDSVLHLSLACQISTIQQANANDFRLGNLSIKLSLQNGFDID